MTQIFVQQNTKEWLEAKEDLFGASEIAPIAGLSRYVLPLHYLQYKCKQFEPIESTENMQLGHQYEDPIAKHFEQVMKVQVQSETMYVHPTITWLSCSPDRRIIPNGYYIEIKLKVHGNLPEYPELEHICQVQHQMFVLNTPALYLVYGTRDNKLRIFLIQRNVSFYDTYLLPRIYEFREQWMNYRKQQPQQHKLTLTYTSTYYQWTRARMQSTFKIDQVTGSAPCA